MVRLLKYAGGCQRWSPNSAMNGCKLRATLNQRLAVVEARLLQLALDDKAAELVRRQDGVTPQEANDPNPNAHGT